MEDVVLAAFFVVENELEGEPRAVGPACRRWRPPIAHHVAGIVGHGRKTSEMFAACTHSLEYGMMRAFRDSQFCSIANVRPPRSTALPAPRRGTRVIYGNRQCRPRPHAVSRCDHPSLRCGD